MPQKLSFKTNLLKYENDIQDFWNIINTIIGKRKVISPFPNKIIVDNLEIADILLITERLIIFLLFFFLLLLALNWFSKFLSQIAIIYNVLMLLHLHYQIKPLMKTNLKQLSFLLKEIRVVAIMKLLQL